MKQISIFFVIFAFLTSNTLAQNFTEFDTWKKQFKVVALKNSTDDR